MHLVIRGILIVSLLLGASVSAADTTKPKRQRVMVLDFPETKGFDASTLRTLDEFLSGAIRDQGFEVITPSQIGAVLGMEKQRALLGCSESSCLAELGGAMGANYIVMGHTSMLENDSALTLTAVNQKGIAVGSQRRVVKGKTAEALIQAIETLVPKLMAELKPDSRISASNTATTPNLTGADVKPQPPPAGGLQSSSAASQDGGSPTGAYVLMGTGAALLVASAVVGVMAHSAQTSAQNDIQNAKPGDVVKSDQSSVKNLALISTALTGAGVVAAGAGGAWWLMSGPSSTSATEGTP